MDYFDWEDEKLVKHAVEVLVERHREEYDDLAGKAILGEIKELLRVSDDLDDELIEKLQAMNPAGVNVPALTETVAILGAELDKRRGKTG